MKYKIILIILTVLISFSIFLGIEYTLSNKNSKENLSNVNTVKEENEIKEDLPVIIDEKFIEKFEEELNEQVEDNKNIKINNNKNKNSKTINNKVEEKVKEETSPDITNEININSEDEANTEVIQPSNQVENQKTVVSTQNKTEKNILPYNYGINIIETNTYKVITYSDSTQDKLLMSTMKKYDKSGYNGTTEKLKSEAQIVANSNKSIYIKLLSYVNNYRSEVGVDNITLDDKLSLAATIRAMELAYSGKFEHNRPNGTLFFTILNELGISFYTTGENIAFGQSTVKDVAASWRNSTNGHYESMINSDYNKIGIGMYNLDGENYWVQLFTN